MNTVFTPANWRCAGEIQILTYQCTFRLSLQVLLSLLVSLWKLENFTCFQATKIDIARWVDQG